MIRHVIDAFLSIVPRPKGMELFREVVRRVRFRDEKPLDYDVYRELREGRCVRTKDIPRETYHIWEIIEVSPCGDTLVVTVRCQVCESVIQSCLPDGFPKKMKAVPGLIITYDMGLILTNVSCHDLVVQPIQES